MKNNSKTDFNIRRHLSIKFSFIFIDFGPQVATHNLKHFLNAFLNRFKTPGGGGL